MRRVVAALIVVDEATAGQKAQLFVEELLRGWASIDDYEVTEPAWNAKLVDCEEDDA